MTSARPEWIFPFAGHPPGSAGWSAWSPNAAGAPTADRPARGW
ncbi:hypothetical protein M2302_004984 [Micromonospora sp. A200]|nr:hypothetical protein [Micromonospora sp. A200]